MERALTNELREVRRRQLREQLEQAMKDPLLLRDIQDVETAFAEADAETAGRIG